LRTGFLSNYIAFLDFINMSLIFYFMFRFLSSLSFFFFTFDTSFETYDKSIDLVYTWLSKVSNETIFFTLRGDLSYFLFFADFLPSLTNDISDEFASFCPTVIYGHPSLVFCINLLNTKLPAD